MARRYAVAQFAHPSTGKRQRVRLGRYRNDSQKARDALYQFAEKHRAMVSASKDHTVGKLWELWLEERKEDGFSNDIYEAQWVSLKPAFAARLPLLLTTKDFRNYARARFKQGRSAWTVHNELVRIRTCLKWAFETNLIPRRVKVWVPSAGGHRERVLSLAEARS